MRPIAALEIRFQVLIFLACREANTAAASCKKIPAGGRGGTAVNAIGSSEKIRNKLWKFELARRATDSPKELLAVVSKRRAASSQRKADKMSKPTEEQIRVRAHELWEKAGKPEGREDEFWRQAEKELAQGATSDEKSTTFLE